MVGHLNIPKWPQFGDIWESFTLSRAYLENWKRWWVKKLSVNSRPEKRKRYAKYTQPSTLRLCIPNVAITRWRKKTESQCKEHTVMVEYDSKTTLACSISVTVYFIKCVQYLHLLKSNHPKECCRKRSFNNLRTMLNTILIFTNSLFVCF